MGFPRSLLKYFKFFFFNPGASSSLNIFENFYSLDLYMNLHVCWCVDRGSFAPMVESIISNSSHASLERLGFLSRIRNELSKPSPKHNIKGREPGKLQIAGLASVGLDPLGPFAWRCSCLQWTVPEERKRKPKVGFGLIWFPFWLCLKVSSTL